jgi:MFS superfamily sulfate permease-like transporter
VIGPEQPLPAERAPGAVAPAAPRPGAIRFDAHEWVGAFGDLGTLVPFVVSYIVIAGVAPFGILIGFGLALIGTGLFYRTPVPVQPMKAIGAIATAQGSTLALAPTTIAVAGLITGLVWLALGLTGIAQRLVRLVSRPVTAGLVLGLGLALGWTALRLVAHQWLMGAIAAGVTLLLLRISPLAAIPALLAGGAGIAYWMDPTIINDLLAMEPALPQPTFPLARAGWSEMAAAVVLLVLPQLPLTVGNALIAVTREHNRLFPALPVKPKTIALTTGAINIGGALVGGVPMCHGAGGLAGHVRFGARTGGATIILGILLLVLGLFFSTSVGTVFRLFPAPILGVILLVAALELIRGAGWEERDWRSQLVMLLTAGLCLWNVALAFVVGFALQFLLRLHKTAS